MLQCAHPQWREMDMAPRAGGASSCCSLLGILERLLQHAGLGVRVAPVAAQVGPLVKTLACCSLAFAESVAGQRNTLGLLNSS
jgi:hypothetical protein